MRQFIAVFTVLAVVYLVIGTSFAMPIPAVLKILPLLVLLYWAWREAGACRSLLLAALGFGMGGDLALAFGWFIPGLGLFLVGHIFYIALWCRELDFSRYLLLLPLLLLSGLGAAYLLPHTGEMTLYVAIYFAVIALMAAAASLSRLVNVFGLLGVYSFLLSDFIIGWNRFIDPLAWAATAIMVTYYLAQLLMLISVLQYQAKSRKEN